MAEMVLTPPLRADGREPNFLQKFGHAFVHGDIFTKLSLFVWGLGYIGHGQLIKALLVTLVQGLGLYFLGTSGIPALKKFGTLGTVQMEMQFNPLTLKNEVNNYDNSFAILLLSVIALVVIVTLIAAAMLVVQSNYALQAQKAAGKKAQQFPAGYHLVPERKVLRHPADAACAGRCGVHHCAAVHPDCGRLYQLRPAAPCLRTTCSPGWVCPTSSRCLAAAV